ncbi:type II secretion system F family protein [Pseudomonas capeferrum]|uniref:type II secretion system F family protein n=1 Tax=Pseudomonas capeferrum TaxID=1495066 RepID=UPI0015E35571|nr:type II secretion system F family protein [Pseudomonas capeferrum]MBA1202573.1 type II secretion system F family protein [Pseudomonas capeferrum]
MSTKTHLFAWEGIDASGTPVKGQASGRTLTIVQAGLQRQGIQVSRLRVASRLTWRLPARAGKADPAGFSRQLATLLKAGVPLLQAFEVMSRSGCSASLETLLRTLGRDVAAGLSLADALQRNPMWFDALYCDLVRVGEQSGTLDRQLEQLAGMLEQRQALRKRVRKAMLYPLLLLVTGLSVAALLLLEVVPRFQSLFASFDRALPAFTQWVIDLSQALASHAGWLAPSLCVSALGLQQAYRRKPEVRVWLMRQALRLPILGMLLSQAALARFARCLATAYSAGVPLLDALATVAPTSGDPLHERAILRLRQGMGNGQGLHQAMAEDPLFTPLLIQLSAIGESSGTLDEMLARAASHYEDQVSQSLEQLTSLLEPAIVLILGVLVGGLVVAMYLPIFQLGNLI